MCVCLCVCVIVRHSGDSLARGLLFLEQLSLIIRIKVITHRHQSSPVSWGWDWLKDTRWSRFGRDQGKEKRGHTHTSAHTHFILTDSGADWLMQVVVFCFFFFVECLMSPNHYVSYFLHLLQPLSVWSSASFMTYHDLYLSVTSACSVASLVPALYDVKGNPGEGLHHTCIWVKKVLRAIKPRRLAHLHHELSSPALTHLRVKTSVRPSLLSRILKGQCLCLSSFVFLLNFYLIHVLLGLASFMYTLGFRYTIHLLTEKKAK